MKVKNKTYVQHLVQTVTIIDDLASLGLFVTGPLQPFEARGKVLLKTWKTGSPGGPLEERETRPWDVLLTTPAALKPAGIEA